MASRGHAPGWTLAASILASSLSFVDGSVTNVALPAIREDLAASAAQLQWVVNAYLLPLSALLLLGGAAGDRYGRRRMFLVGVAGFAVSSLTCALAPSLTVLLAGRFAQGASAAMLSHRAAVGNVYKCRPGGGQGSRRLCAALTGVQGSSVNSRVARGSMR